MASVVFIIRVPYESTSVSATSELENQSISSNKEQNLGEKQDGINDDDDQDRTESVKEVKDDDSSKSKLVQIVDKSEPGKNSETANTELDETATDVEMFTSPLNMAKVLQNELRSLNVQGDSWTITNDKNFHQVVFLEKTGERVEKILARLTSTVGIGKRPKSSISIISTSVHIQLYETEYVKGKRISKCESIQNNAEIENQPLLVEKESTKDKFKKSIKARLTVEQVVESVRNQALLTFDFVMFTVLASLIAAVGLVEDNAVVLVASMLVSPLMGPILGGTFGTVIKNNSLRNTGLKTELCGLILSVVVGFVFGLICGPFGVNGASWDTMKGVWPTNEMTSRGMTRALWVGILIALPSGAGVALSVLGGNTGSLVGVAISASLLPPAVNSGMLWAYSIIAAIKPLEVLGNAEHNSSTLNCPPFKDNRYVPMYNCDMDKEAAIMAIISLVLTVINIICILITATIVLKIKEVAPKASSSNATQTFWTKDVKVAREAYSTFRGNQAANFLKEWKKVHEPNRDGWRDSLQENVELLDIVKEVEENEDYQSVVRRAPRGAQNLHKCSRRLERIVSQDEDYKAEDQAEALENHLKTLHNHYSIYPRDQGQQPHVGTLFDEQETQPKKGVREFHVTETFKPHHTSVVRVRPPTEEDNRFSVTTESGV